MNLSENYITQLKNLAGIVSENRINKLYAEKFPQEIINFTLNFAKETTKNPSNEEDVNKNQYIPWIAYQTKKNPDIINKKTELNTIINWIKKSGYNKINSNENFESVYEKAKEWLKSKNINLDTGERVEGGKVVKKYPNGYQWIQATEVNWCINAGTEYGWCFNQLNRAEQFVGFGDIGVNNKGYFLLDNKHKPIIALQYDSYRHWIEDIQAAFNKPLTSELLPYAFDIFKDLPLITDIKGYLSSFWNSFNFPGGEKFKEELLKIPSISFDLNTKLHHGFPLTKEELKTLPIDRKLRFNIPLNQEEINSLGIDDKINFGYVTKKEKEELPVFKKVEYEIPFSERDLASLNAPILNRLAKVISKKEITKNLFIEKDFEGFKDFTLNENSIQIDIEEDEFEKKYSGLDEYSGYYQNYTSSNEEVDDEELNYMNSYLTGENLEKIKNLSKILGVSEKYNFEDSSEIKDFIKENLPNSEEIFEEYKADLSTIIGDAKENSIKETLNKEQKFKYIDGYLVLPIKELYKFLKTNKININKFKDLEDLEINGEIDLEGSEQDYYDKIDNELVKTLNVNVGKKIDDSLELIEDNPNYSNNVTKFYNIVSNLKFEKGNFTIYSPSRKGQMSTHKGSADYKLELPKKTIFIKDVNYIDEKISVFIIEYSDKNKKTFKKMLKGNIPFDSLVDYVQQYSLFENQLREKIREILSEDFRYLYDNNNFTPTREVIQTAQKAIQAVQNNKLVQSDASNEGSGLRKAQSLSSGEQMTHAQLKRMKSFFDSNYQAVQNEKNAGKNINNSPLIQKWELWGGDAGKNWAEKEISSTQSSNKTSKKVRNSDMIARDNRIMNPLNTRIRK